MKRVNEGFIVVTEAGPVLVRVREGNRGGFDPELLELGPVTEADRQAAAFETPLRAFAAKMVDIIEAAGTGGIPESMTDMMIREKAAADLKRIDRWAQQNLTE